MGNSSLIPYPPNPESPALPLRTKQALTHGQSFCSYGFPACWFISRSSVALSPHPLSPSPNLSQFPTSIPLPFLPSLFSSSLLWFAFFFLHLLSFLPLLFHLFLPHSPVPPSPSRISFLNPAPPPSLDPSLLPPSTSPSSLRLSGDSPEGPAGQFTAGSRAPGGGMVQRPPAVGGQALRHALDPVPHRHAVRIYVLGRLPTEPCHYYLQVSTPYC